MKITILNVTSDKNKTMNKDLAGGYGTGTHIGSSLRARIIEWLKKSNVKLPILTAGYIAAIFAAEGHEVEYLENKIPSGSDIVFIPTSIVDCHNELYWAKSVKQALPDAKIGFFGAFATAVPSFYKNSADFVIVGEPEAVCEEIAKTGDVPAGNVMSPVITDLDRLPFPKWDIFPWKNYSYSPVIKRKPFLTVQSSRGCVFSCSDYCPYTALQGTKWRNRSVKNVLDEFRYLVEKFGVRGILFRDPLFTFNKQRVSEIAQGIIDNGWDIEWGCETRLDLLNKDLIDLLYKSGMRSINVGIESADPEVCKTGKRLPIQIKHQEEILEYCDKKGIRISAFYIIGLGNDTVESVRNTISYAKKINTHIAQFTISTPYPGTPFYHQMEPLIYDHDWEHFDAYTPVWKHPNLSREQMQDLKEEAFIGYYFRPKYILAFLRRMLK